MGERKTEKERGPSIHIILFSVRDTSVTQDRERLEMEKKRSHERCKVETKTEGWKVRNVKYLDTFVPLGC